MEWTPGKIIAVSLAGLLALVIIGGVIDFACGYANEGKRVVGVENVKDQNAHIIEGYESLKAAAANACDVGNAKAEEGDPTLVERPDAAYNAIYRRVAVDYNSRVKDIYKARFIRNLPLPHNLREYPTQAPSLTEMKAEVC